MTDTDTEKEVPEKISDQAVLMLKLREMAQISHESHTIPIFRAPPGSANDLIKNNSVSDKKRRFNNLCVLDYEFPYAIPNILLSHEDSSDAMLKLTTLQLSMLLPRIRIFKTVFDSNLNEELHVELPFDDIANKDDIERIYTSGAGRGSGCGLKSFEWKSLGKNQANIAQFSATMKLYLQNIEEMQQPRNSIQAANGRVFEVSVLDLIIQKPDLRSGVNEGSNVFDPKYFGIKVEVGWRLDPNTYETFKDESRRYGEDPKKILSIVLDQTQIFYLTLNSHQLDINQDGSVELTIDYIASAEIESVDPISANVLRLTTEDEYQLQIAIDRARDVNRQLNSLSITAKKSDAAFKELEEANENLYQKFVTSGQGTYSDYVDKHYRVLSPEDKANRDNYARLEKEKKEADKSLEQLKKNQRMARLSSILTNLLHSNLINSMCISNTDLNTLTSLRSNSIETVDDLDNVKSSLDTIKLNLKIVPNSSTDNSAIEALKSASESGDTKQQKIISTLDASAIDKVSPKICPDNSTQISFFFFGDLLNTVLENIFNVNSSQINNFISKTTRILLGPITYYDFGSIEDHGLIIRSKGTKDKNGELVSVYHGKQTIVNMADIPISVREFQRWFVKNIVDQGRENLSFLDFSKAIIDDLIISAISGDTYKFAPRQQVRINLMPFSVPKLDHNEEMFEEVVKNRDIVKSFRFDLNSGHNFNGRTLKPFLNSNLKSKKQNYILFYGINQPPLERIAEQRKDLEQKIYHIFIGEERGLVKNITFSRDDNPRQRATNIQQSNPEKQGDGMIIREKYSANVDLFGNFLFIPGQQVFVHPTYAGLKGRNVRENIFRNLGLGGYYRVIETNSRIMSGEFTTSISTKWEAFGDGTLNIGDQLVGQQVGTEILGHQHDDLNTQQTIEGPSNRVKLVGDGS